MAAWVKGEATDAGTAIGAAAALLAAARAPVIAGLSAEVSAIRAACALAGRIGASLDTAGAAGTYAELGALGHGGAMTAPPAEVAGRADVVLVVGAVPWRTALLDRLGGSGPTRGRAAGAGRILLALGATAPSAALTCPAEGGLPEALACLRACCRGHLAGDAGPAAPFVALARRLAAAQYAAVVYDAAEIGEPGVEMLLGLVSDLNEGVRCFSLALSGPDQDRAAVPVTAWTTGQAPRTGFGRRVPEHDPWRFDAARQVAAGEADAALWLASVPVPLPGWLGRVPSVALVGEPAPDAAQVVITVGVPGRDLGGVLWNDDRAALTYWPAKVPGGEARPSAASILASLSERLDARPSGGRADPASLAARRSEPAC